MVKEFIHNMSLQVGTSGHEESVSQFVRGEFEKYCDEVSVDEYFNVTGIMRGDKWGTCEEGKNYPRIMICAHMDEIAMMVKEIDDDGFIRVSTVGGFDMRLLPGLEVIIHGKEDIRGIMAAKPNHVQEDDEKGKALGTNSLFIDTGCSAEKVKDIVSIGDIVTYDSEMGELKNGLLFGKAMDDRAGIAILIATMLELKRFHFGAEVSFVATVQEEVGTKGAQMVSYRIKPDIGIAIDVTHGSSPDAPAPGTIPMDKGICMAFGPNMHPTLFNRLKSVADDYAIPYATELCKGPTGTDARSIQISGEGIPTLLLEIPLRYMHTPVEVISLDAVKKAGRLLANFIADMKEDWEQWTTF